MGHSVNEKDHGRRELPSLSEQEKDLSMAVMSAVMNNSEEENTQAETLCFLAENGLEIRPGAELTVAVAEVRGRRFLPLETVVTVNEILRRSYACGSFVLGGSVYSLITAEDGFQELDSLLEEVRTVLEEEFNESCRIGIGSCSAEPVSLLGVCFEAIDACQYRAGRGVRRIGTIHEEIMEKIGEEKLVAADFDRLLVYGRRQDLEDFLFSRLGESASEIGMLQILMIAYSVFRLSLGGNEAQRLLRRYGLLEPLSSLQGKTVLRRSIRDFCLEGSDLIAKRKQNDMKLLIERVSEFIDLRYMDPELTLNYLSGHLNVTPNYLSAQIKRYKGRTFMDLLTSRRMEAAAELLKTTDLKVAEIAERCGYTDPHYFSYCYKKYYREAPLATRKKTFVQSV